MLQDVMAKKNTEVDIFAGKIIELGKKYNIPTPENSAIYEKISKIQNEYLLSKV
jgi:2-dehydropantoate 2-reductase